MLRSGRARRVWVIAALLPALFAGRLLAQASAVPAVDIQLDQTHSSEVRRRVELAAHTAAQSYTAWLGPLSRPAIVIADRDRDGDVAAIEVPWCRWPAAMDVESEVADAMGRVWLRSRFNAPRDAATVDGIARFLQSRVVEHLYDLVFLQPGHSAEVLRFFGGTIAWPVPALRLSRWTAGVGRPEWLRSHDDSRRVALELASFERLAGWPRLQGVLFATMHTDPRNETSLVQLLNEAAGQIVITESAPPGRRDLAIASVISTPCVGRPCVHTRVTVTSNGQGPLRAVPLRIDFMDGQHIVTRWDGAEPARDFEFESPAPHVAVRLDPDGTFLTDRNLLNNSHFARESSNVPLMKWLARWTVWLEGAALTYSGLF